MISFFEDVVWKSPYYLWLLIPVLIGIFALVWRRVMRVREGMLRFLLFSALALAISEPVTREEETQERLTALVDLSASVPKPGIKAFAELLHPFVKTGRELSIIPFARTPLPQIAIPRGSSAEEIFDILKDSIPSLDQGGTNIAKALDRANGPAPSSVEGPAAVERPPQKPGILLLSDGFENEDLSSPLAATLGREGRPIFPIIPPRELFEAPVIELRSLHAPLIASAGEVVDTQLAVRNSRSAEDSHTVELFLDGKSYFSQKLVVAQGEERPISAKTPPLGEGLQRIRAVVKNSAGKEIDVAERWISTKERQKVLLLSGTEADARVLKRLVTALGFPLESIVLDGGEKVPSELRNYKTVILNNVARRQLSAGFLSLLTSHIEEGAGLIISGGERAFGLGGYIDSPLDALSPLRSVPPKIEKKRLPAAVVMIIDKSRSMEQGGRMLLAQRSALAAIESLKDDDFVGVVAFDMGPYVVIRLAPAGQVKGDAAMRLSRIIPNGGTQPLLALQEARRALARAQAGRKHVIILTDGEFADAGSAYIDEVKRMRSAGITVSTIAMGLEADAPQLKMLADFGNGTFYQPQDARKVPEIFVQDIKVSTGERTMREESKFSVVKSPSASLVANIETPPPLLGFVETKPSSDATLELSLQTQGGPQPLLASRRVGRGKAIAFSSDSIGRWSQPWLQWKGFSDIWSTLLEAAGGKRDAADTTPEFDFRYSTSGREVLLEISFFGVSGGEIRGKALRATVIGPGGDLSKISLQESAPGRYNGVIPGARPGDYRLSMTLDGAALPPLGLTLEGEIFGEIAGRGIEESLLRRLAVLSGGKVNPRPEDVATVAQKMTVDTPLFWIPLLGAFLLLLLEPWVRLRAARGRR